METQKLSVYNSTRRSYLGHEIALVDPTVDSLRKIVEYLAFDIEPGLWFTPFEEIPPVPGIPQFDLVCLDTDRRVIHALPSIGPKDLAPFTFPPSSALVLPPQTIFDSHTQPGDQLLIHTAEEMVHRLFELSRNHRSTPVQESQPAIAAQPVVPAPPTPNTHISQPLAPQTIFGQSLEREPSALHRDSFKARLLRLLGSDRRRASRYAFRDLVAYRWDGDASHPHPICDISESGVYVVTEDRLLVGTKVLMTVQKKSIDGSSPGNSIAVQTKVVRWGNDGEGLSFILSGKIPKSSDGYWPESVADKKAVRQFLHRMQEDGEELQLR